jgi:hypothetical protein
MDEEPGYLDRVIRARCGDEIADQVIEVETLELVLQVIAVLEERITALGAPPAAADGLPEPEAMAG